MKPRFNKEMVEFNLRHISDEVDQRYYWFPNPSNEMYCFIEACCGLFTDSGLYTALKSGGSGLSQDFDLLIRNLDRVLTSIDEFLPAEVIISCPEMTEARHLAKLALLQLYRDTSQDLTS